MSTNADPEALLRGLVAETPRLQRLARSLLAGRDLADDVVQETLLRACRRPAAGVQHVRGWLAAVATSVARRFARSEARQARHVRALPPREPEPSVAEAVARTEALQRVAAALLALAEPYRTVLLLRFQNELGYAAIAARLGVPIETVRTRLKRGLHQLRRELDERRGGRAAWSGPLVAWHPARPALVAVPVAGAVLLGAGLWLAGGADGAPVRAPREVAVAAAASEVPPSPAEATLALHGETRSAAVRGDPEPVADESTGSTGSRVAAPAAGLWFTFRVVDAATKAPIPGASVRADDRFVRLVPSTGGANGDDASSRSAVTDATGRCRLRWNGLGSSAQVTVRAPGYGALVHWPEFGGDPVAPGTIGECLFPDLELAPARALAGRVTAAGGLPAPDAAVFVVVDKPPLLLVERVATADGSGAFDFVVPSPVRNGTAHLFATHDGSVAVAALPASDGIVLRMLPLADVVVDCVDERSRPVAGAHVFATALVPPFAAALRMVGGDPLPPRHRHATTDATGRASLGRLPVAADATCVLVAHAVGHRGEHRTQSLAPGPHHVRVVLPRGERATVCGVVLDAASQRPIAGAAVAGAVGGGGVRTDRDGAFVLADVDLSRGVVQLQVEALGHAPSHHEESVGGRTGELSVRLLLAPAVGPVPDVASGVVIHDPRLGGTIMVPETTPAPAPSPTPTPAR